MTTSLVPLVNRTAFKSQPICSWRLKNNPDLELRVSKNRTGICYAVYNSWIKEYWESKASSSEVFTLGQCIWKDSEGIIESRLFRNDLRSRVAIIVSANVEEKKIAVVIWKGNYDDNFLIKYEPVMSADAEGFPILEESTEERGNHRILSYEPTAEEGVVRYHEAAEESGKIIKEEIVKVWAADREIRFIKRNSGSQEDMLCRVFDRALNDSRDVSYSSENVGFLKGKELIRLIREYNLPQLLYNASGVAESVIFYGTRDTNPLVCFMKDCVLSQVDAAQVSAWVKQQFYYKDAEGKVIQGEYTDCIKAEKIKFSFNPNNTDPTARAFKDIETWHVSMQMYAAFLRQGPMCLLAFFSGIFFADAQKNYQLSEINRYGMESLICGVPSIAAADRKTVIDHFTTALEVCATINLYVACDRSNFIFDVAGRRWILRCCGAGKSIRNTIGSTGRGIGSFFSGTEVKNTMKNAVEVSKDVAKVAKNAAEVVKNGKEIWGSFEEIFTKE